MTSLGDLANDYHRYRQSTDHLRQLWKGDLDYIDGWEAITSEAITGRQERLRDYADRAERFTDLDPVSLSLAETVAFTARSAANELTWRTELTFPTPPIGLVSTILTFLPRYSLTTGEHGDAYLRKLQALPEMLHDAGAGLRRGRETGVLPISRHLTGTIAGIDGYLARADGDPLLAQAPPTELSNVDRARWRDEAARIVGDLVRPALARYRDVIVDVVPDGRSDSEPGLCHLEGGSDHYRDLVWSNTSLDLTGEQIHEIGLEQVTRLEEEYRAVAGSILETRDIDEIYARLRDDPALAYTSGADLVEDATRALARATARAKDWFGTLPTSPCVGQEIEQGPLAFYSKPIPEFGKPGVFFFNTSDPSAWKRFQVESVTFHESIPGHHLQLAMVTEDPTIHGVHTDLPITVYSEGWGLYAERLADEMGLYSTEMDRIGMLSADSMRACRLVTDTGMHALGWSRTQAVDYILQHSPLSRGIAEGEIDRYIGMPGQALSYMMGRLEIDRLRAVSESRPGFDIRAFHDGVLGNGMVPLPTLQRIVLG